MSSTDKLRDLVRDTRREGHGAMLRRALLTLVIPAAVGLGCTPCLYAGPHVEDATSVTVEPSVDCDGDGVAESTSTESCPPGSKGELVGMP